MRPGSDGVVGQCVVVAQENPSAGLRVAYDDQFVTILESPTAQPKAYFTTRVREGSATTTLTLATSTSTAAGNYPITISGGAHSTSVTLAVSGITGSGITMTLAGGDTNDDVRRLRALHGGPDGAVAPPRQPGRVP